MTMTRNANLKILNVCEGSDLTKCKVSLTTAKKLGWRGFSVLNTAWGRIRLLIMSGSGQGLDWNVMKHFLI